MKKIPRSLEILESTISKLSGQPIEKIREHNRSQPLNDIRMSIWYVAYDYLGFTYNTIGEIYDRDHTTIINGVNKIRKNDNRALLAKLKKECPSIFDRTYSSKTGESWL